MKTDKDKKLIQQLWSAIENGTLERDFFKLREKVRKALARDKAT